MCKVSRDVWDVFEQAYSYSNNTLDFDDNSSEFGQNETYGEIKNSLELTVSYWTDVSTVGGSVLFEYGYWEGLPDDFMESLEKYKKELSSVKKQLAKKYFGE